jgi:hypothetical protein
MSCGGRGQNGHDGVGGGGGPCDAVDPFDIILTFYLSLKFKIYIPVFKGCRRRFSLGPNSSLMAMQDWTNSLLVTILVYLVPVKSVLWIYVHPHPARSEVICLLGAGNLGSRSRCGPGPGFGSRSEISIFPA